MQTKFTPLTDTQWQPIQKMLNGQRRRRLDLRQVVDAIRYLTRGGIQWRNLPKTYPAWQSVYYYYRRWKSSGLLAQLLEALTALCRRLMGRAAQPSRVAIDSQSVHKVCFLKEDPGLDAHKKSMGANAIWPSTAWACQSPSTSRRRTATMVSKELSCYLNSSPADPGWS